MNQLLKNLTVTCVDCENPVAINKLQKRTERCADCREAHEESLRDANNKKKTAAYYKGPRCSCGCSRPRGKGRRFLSDYCYKNGGEMDYSPPFGWDLEPAPLSEQPLITSVEATL